MSSHIRSFLTRGPSRMLVASVSALALASVAGAQEPAKIHIPGRLILPESITSSADGAVFVGSIAEGAIYRAAPGAAEADATPFVASHAHGLQGVFGVLADDATGTLWACSSTLSFGPPPSDAPAPPPGELFAFDLASGELKSSYKFPSPGSVCNDIAVGADGSVYATDTQNMQVVRLPKGGSALEVWSPDGAFGPPGGVLDGISVVGDRVVVNTLLTSKLFGVDIGADGKAGAVVEYKLDREIVRPDGMRTFGDGVLIVEGGANRLSRIVLEGDAGTVTTVGEGLAGPVAVTVVGETAYVLEGQFASMQAGPDAEVPPIHAVGFPVGTP